jgi:hypothetical protein
MGAKAPPVTYSFQPQPPDIFNMVVRDTWAQFHEAPPH